MAKTKNYYLRTPVKRERMAELVEVLRSGKYKQAFTRMRGKGNCFCLAGLMCELSELGTWDGNDKSSNRNFLLHGEKDVWRCAPPRKVINHFGFHTKDLTSEYPKIFIDGNFKAVIEINDIDKLSFNAIADLIEQTYLVA